MKIKKLLSLILVSTLFVTCMCTTAFAKEGPADYYDSYEKDTRLTVGSDISAGKYMLFNTQDSKSASVSIKADNKNILSDTFWYNYIIDVDPDDVVYLSNCYLVDYDEAMVFAPEEGFFEVGKHIDPGTYYIEWVRGDSSCKAIKYTNLYYSDDSEYTESGWKTSYSASRGNYTELELVEGQYIKLTGCRLIYESSVNSN